MPVDLNLLFTESVKHFMHGAEQCLHLTWRLQEDWPDWKEDFRGRAEALRPTVLASLNPADERVVLRDAIRARLDQLLADDARLQAILAAHREYDALQEHIGRINEEIAFFRARRLVPALRLMRLRLLRGD